MVDVSASIDEAALADLAALLERIGTLTPKRLASETRHAAILLCRSLRARTRTAPKKIPKSEWAARTSWAPPRYAHSNSKSRALLRRWTLARKLHTPDAYAKHYFVYTKARRGKDGKMVGKNEAEELRELLRVHGGISRPGLARMSWGWIAQQIYNASGFGKLAYAPRRRERRDPRREASGVFKALRDGGEATLLNKLDYILDALRPGALDESVRAATNSLYRSVEASLEAAEEARAAAPVRRRGGMPWWQAYERAQGRSGM